MNLHDANHEVESLEKLIKDSYGDLIELFVHIDGCAPFSCRICEKKVCAERTFEFSEKVEWTTINLFENRKHEVIY
jgi:predicted transcriptional regulator